MTQHRDRASGWKHAKLSGHNNEEDLRILLENDREYRSTLLTRIGVPLEQFSSVSIGGLNETNVESIVGKKTKSKTDCKIYLSDNDTCNISIKKSLSGQVYFVSVSMFIKVFEAHFNTTIPNNVQRAMRLFWAEASDAIDIINSHADKSNDNAYQLQLRHKSLNATTLKNYDYTLYTSLLNWFKENIYNITMLSFSMGGAKEQSEWSKYIWYKNTLGENATDDIFLIEDICNVAAKASSSQTSYSTKNGGTTIQLPFGFVQWHQKKMQFHHDYNKISNLLNTKKLTIGYK